MAQKAVERGKGGKNTVVRVRCGASSGEERRKETGVEEQGRRSSETVEEQSLG